MWGWPALLVGGILWWLICLSHLNFAFEHDGRGGAPRDVISPLGPPPVQHTAGCGKAGLVSRPHSVSITEFGAIGDGKTLNTHAFENAIFYLRTFAEKGGAQLYVPPGEWVTGSFSLTSHLTLFLDYEAVIIGTQSTSKWPLIDPLPSYGRGRELPGQRHMSLIYGENLTDVIIAGDNGTVDGQGFGWWDLFRNGSLDYTRPHLVEFINSDDILFHNVTFRNSPFWCLHPVYCRSSFKCTFNFSVWKNIFSHHMRCSTGHDFLPYALSGSGHLQSDSSNVVFQLLTIIAPHNSPNTDGIDPDSSTDVCIEDCFISTGDDAISIKSGWDEYGISVGKPSANIDIRRVVAITPTSAGIAIGSEMSGGVANVSVKNMTILNSRTGFRLKTAIGRGGYVTNISVSEVIMHNVSTAIAFTGQYGDHPDDKYDPEAYPRVDQIAIKSVYGELITEAGTLFGISQAPFQNICLAEIFLHVSGAVNWNCSDVQGYYSEVLPMPCSELLKDRGEASICPSHYPSGGCLHNLHNLK